MKIRTYIKTENPTLWQGFCQIKSELLHLNDQAITGLHADSWFFYKSMWPLFFALNGYRRRLDPGQPFLSNHGLSERIAW